MALNTDGNLSELNNKVLLQMTEGFGRMEGMLCGLVADHKRVLSTQDNHAGRIASLEKGRAWLYGAVAAVALLASIAAWYTENKVNLEQPHVFYERPIG